MLNSTLGFHGGRDDVHCSGTYLVGILFSIWFACWFVCALVARSPGPGTTDSAWTYVPGNG